jgi:NitT/TauT family transport system substrate-binding protein
VINDPTVYDVKTALGTNSIDMPAQEGQDFSWLVISSAQFLQNHPEAAKRFLTSLVMAENFAKSDPVKSKQIMENKFSLDPKYFDQNWPKHNFAVTLDQSLIIILENESRWEIGNMDINQTMIPNYLNFFYFDALTSVKPDAVTIVH